MRATGWAVLLGACTASPPPVDDTDTAADTEPAAPTCAPAAWVDPPACGSGPVDRSALLPGPAQTGFDADLDAKALRHERLFHTFVAASMGLNTEITVPEGAQGDALQSFIEGDAWELDAKGPRVEDIVTRWEKSAGAYAGMGIAADAFRYGVLRDEGAPCAEVDRARTHLLRGLEGLHRAVEITGTPGVIARGYARNDPLNYGSFVEVVPLADEGGTPLPAEKTNGTWRADVSGQHPEFVWEDSCSRDMLMGWAFGFGAASEVIARDPAIADAVKATLRTDAAAIAWSLLEVRESGYDLEVMDADGRRTYHGILHEESVDRIYTPGIFNGQNAAMAMGILSALATAAEDDALHEAVLDRTVREHDLPGILQDGLPLIDFGVVTNYSNVHMAMQGVVLAQRYTCDNAARAVVAEAADTSLYAVPGRTRQPEEQEQALYSIVATMARRGGGATASGTEPVNSEARDATLVSLRAFPDAPYRDVYIENCDADEVEAGSCLGIDGTPLTPLGDAGRNDTPIAQEPVPMRIRPPSNYHWRSNPYQVNGGGDGSRVLPAVDFRIAYWMGRWAR